MFNNMTNFLEAYLTSEDVRKETELWVNFVIFDTLPYLAYAIFGSAVIPLLGVLVHRFG